MQQYDSSTTAGVVLDSALWGLYVGAIMTISISWVMIPAERNNKNVRYELKGDKI